MKCRITFDVKNEDEFIKLRDASRLPGEKWELFSDTGFLVTQNVEHDIHEQENKNE